MAWSLPQSVATCPRCSPPTRICIEVMARDARDDVSAARSQCALLSCLSDPCLVATTRQLLGFRDLRAGHARCNAVSILAARCSLRMCSAVATLRLRSMKRRRHIVQPCIPPRCILHPDRACYASAGSGDSHRQRRTGVTTVVTSPMQRLTLHSGNGGMDMDLLVRFLVGAVLFVAVPAIVVASLMYFSERRPDVPPNPCGFGGRLRSRDGHGDGVHSRHRTCDRKGSKRFGNSTLCVPRWIRR